MKKTLALILALTMGCAMLVSCGDSEDDSSSAKDNDSSSSSVADPAADSDADDNGDSDEADASSDDASSADDSSDAGDSKADDAEETKFDKLVAKITETGECTISMSVEEEGYAIKMYVTTDGDNAYVDMNMLGIQITALTTPDGSYALDTAGKRYYVDETASAEEGTELVDEFTDMADYTFISSATETINGADYFVETYQDADGAEVSFAFDSNDEVCYVGEAGEYFECIFSATADTSKFSIDGYTEMTEDEYLEWYYSLLGLDMSDYE